MYLPRLRDLREDKDMNQSEIATILDTTQENYSRYERGARDLPIKHLKVLADFYGVTADYILGRTNDPYQTTIKQVTVHQRDHNNNTFNL